MPLSTGAQALLGLAIPTGVLQLISFGPMFVTNVPDWVPRWVGGAITLTLGLLWALWFFAMAASLWDAWKCRASDVELSPAGLKVVGGRASGLRMTWDEAGPTACTVKRTGNNGELELRVKGRAVAASTHEDELASFRAVQATISSLARNAEGPRPTTAPPHAIPCASCGAPLVPSAAAGVSCAFCGTRQPMPADVLRRLGATVRLRASRDRVERNLKALLRQPGALATNVLVALAVPPLLFSFPLTSVMFNEFAVTRHVLRGAHALWLVPFALGSSSALALWLQAHVSGRQAIRVVTLAFRARAPARQHEPWGCRQCGAPLPDSEGHQVVHCLYCDAASVTGMDLRTDAQEMATQAGDLDQVLGQHLRRRRRWRVRSLVAAAMFAVSAASLAQAFPTTCRDSVLNGDETDVDCGGRCTRCVEGARCLEAQDCVSAVCLEGQCAVAACNDRVRNGGESDVDCGGPCAPCAAGFFCETVPANCVSGRCGLSGVCE